MCAYSVLSLAKSENAASSKVDVQSSGGSTAGRIFILLSRGQLSSTTSFSDFPFLGGVTFFLFLLPGGRPLRPFVTLFANFALLGFSVLLMTKFSSEAGSGSSFGTVHKILIRYDS
jgi:hypothetical protein